MSTTGLTQQRLIFNTLAALAIGQKLSKFWIFNRSFYCLNEGTSWIMITLGRKIITKIDLKIHTHRNIS